MSGYLARWLAVLVLTCGCSSKKPAKTRPKSPAQACPWPKRPAEPKKAALSVSDARRLVASQGTARASEFESNEEWDRTEAHILRDGRLVFISREEGSEHAVVLSSYEQFKKTIAYGRNDACERRDWEGFEWTRFRGLRDRYGRHNEIVVRASMATIRAFFASEGAKAVQNALDKTVTLKPRGLVVFALEGHTTVHVASGLDASLAHGDADKRVGLAQRVSRGLKTDVVEVWRCEETHCGGYTAWRNGERVERFEGKDADYPEGGGSYTQTSKLRKVEPSKLDDTVDAIDEFLKYWDMAELGLDGAHFVRQEELPATRGRHAFATIRLPTPTLVLSDGPAVTRPPLKALDYVWYP